MATQEMFSDGAITSELVVSGLEPKIYASWIMMLAANSLVSAHRFRVAAGDPGATYGVQVEIYRYPAVDASFDSPHFREGWNLRIAPALFPSYEFGSLLEIDDVLTRLWRDVHNHVGRDLDDTIRFHLECPADLFP
jgi:hypothetical protein